MRRLALLASPLALVSVLLAAESCAVTSADETDGGTRPAEEEGTDGGSARDATGPDADAGVSPRTDAGFELPRTTTDQPDDSPGLWQVHLLYVEPSDRTAAAPLDTNGEIRRSVKAMQSWLAAQTGGPKLRFDTAGGALDVTHVKLATTEAAMAQGTGLSPAGPAWIRERLEKALVPTFADPKKLYLVVYDGLAYGTCGNSLLPGRFPVVYVGGIWTSTYLTAAASAGATSVAAFDPAALGVPAPPFAAKLGGEAVTVNAVNGTTLTLSAPLGAAHATGESLVPDTRPPDCRSNPRSTDGAALGYADFTALHELMHAIGIVSAGAPDFATPPVAGGHLGESGGGGTSDLMYQGTKAWTCATPSKNAATSLCQLDPSKRNYFGLPAGSPLVDLAKSTLMDPLPASPVPPL